MYKHAALVRRADDGEKCTTAGLVPRFFFILCFHLRVYERMFGVRKINKNQLRIFSPLTRSTRIHTLYIYLKLTCEDTHVHGKYNISLLSTVDLSSYSFREMKKKKMISK